MEAVQHTVHQRRVEGPGDPEALGPATTCGEYGRDLLDRLGQAGEHGGARPVDGGDADLVLPARQQRYHLVLGRLDGHHRAAARRVLHQPAARGDQAAGVVLRQHAGRAGRREFADGVAADVVGRHAPGPQEAECRQADGEEPGLGEHGLVEQGGRGGALRGEQDVAQRRAPGLGQVLVQLLAHLVQRLREGRMGPVEALAHAGPLAALAREEEADPAGGHGAPEHSGCGAAGGQRVQSGPQFAQVAAEHDRPVRQGGPGQRQRAPDGGGGGGGELGEVVPQALRLAAQGGRAAGRDRPGDERRGRGRRRFGRCPGLRQGVRRVVPGRVVPGRVGQGRLFGRRRGLFEDHVGVGAADAEGGHARAPGTVPLRPGHRLGEQGDRAGGPVDVRGGGVGVQGGR